MEEATSFKPTTDGFFLHLSSVPKDVRMGKFHAGQNRYSRQILGTDGANPEPLTKTGDYPYRKQFIYYKKTIYSQNILLWSKGLRLFCGVGKHCF